MTIHSRHQIETSTTASGAPFQCLRWAVGPGQLDVSATEVHFSCAPGVTINLTVGWCDAILCSQQCSLCNQVSVLGACLGEPAQACLIMELVEGGSLAQRIHDRKKRRLTYVQILQASGPGSSSMQHPDKENNLVPACSACQDVHCCSSSGVALMHTKNVCMTLGMVPSTSGCGQ
jgi:hypothetical protein